MTGIPNDMLGTVDNPKQSFLKGKGSGGAGGVSTAADYLRFTQMLLNGGQLDGARVLSRSTVALMTSDHLGTRIAAPVTPGELLLGVPGYTFGLGFAVRFSGSGISSLVTMHGPSGENVAKFFPICSLLSLNCAG